MKIGITEYAEKYIEEHTTRKKYYSEESYNKIKQKLEAYENMRKDLLDLILYQYPVLSQSESDFKDDLLNILNKVGGNDE